MTAFEKARRGMLHAIVLMMDKFHITPIDVTEAWLARPDSVNHSSTIPLTEQQQAETTKQTKSLAGDTE